jgi:hypothetical protein
MEPVEGPIMTQNLSIFSEYAQDRREAIIDGFECQVFPHLTRYIPQIKGMDGIVVFAQLPTGDEIECIQNEIDYFSTLDVGFEWKVYDLDEPRYLRALLECQGFSAGESESFMIFQTSQQQIERIPNSLTDIVEINTEQGLRDIATVQQAVWNQSFDWLVTQLSEVLVKKPEELSLYCAYIEGLPVGSGWTSFPNGSRFPELHGGAVVPKWRGKGVYGDLYQVRCLEISNKGFEWTSVDATPMSCPILENLGFKRVCMTHPLRYEFY